MEDDITVRERMSEIKFSVDKRIYSVIMFDMKYVNTLTRRVGWERDRRERSRRLQASYSGTF